MALSESVLVVGAGPAGAATAIALAQAGCPVLLLGAADASRRPQPGPGDVLSPNAMPALVALDLADRLRADRRTAMPLACLTRRWLGTNVEHVPMIAQPGGEAYVVDRRRFDALLRARAGAAGARVVTAGAAVIGATRDRPGVCVRLRDGTEIRARVVVDATGRAARIARGFAVPRIAGRRQFAVCGIVEDASNGGGRLTVAAMPAGWWFVTRGPAGVAFAALTGDPDAVRRGGAAALVAAIDPMLAELPSVSFLRMAGTRVVDAGERRLAQTSGPDWIAVGDAAATFDPIASQGLANSLASALAAAPAILEMLVGDQAARHRYDAAMRATWERSVDFAAQIHAAAGQTTGPSAPRPDIPFATLEAH